MKKNVSLLFLLMFSIACFSQGYIQLNREKVKNFLEKYVSEENMKASFEETDSTIKLLLQDPRYRPAAFVFHFDRKNKCISEIRNACDSCVQKYLLEALNKKPYDWVRVNPTTYLSKYSRHLLMETGSGSGADAATLYIRKINWTKNRYRQFVRTSGKEGGG